MPDKEKYVQEMARVLKPGGRLVIATWCQRDLKKGEEFNPKERKNPRLPLPLTLPLPLSLPLALSLTITPGALPAREPNDLAARDEAVLRQRRRRGRAA